MKAEHAQINTCTTHPLTFGAPCTRGRHAFAVCDACRAFWGDTEAENLRDATHEHEVALADFDARLRARPC